MNCYLIRLTFLSKYLKCSHAVPIIPSSISISSLRFPESLSDTLTFFPLCFLGLSLADFLVVTDFLVATGVVS